MIDIPSVLLHLRAKAVAAEAKSGERLAMKAVSWIFGGRRRFVAAARLGRLGQRPLVRRGRIVRLPAPLAAWTRTRDLRPLSSESFRDWWERRR
jgi:L-lactate dehydrogenase complex protein LldF